MKNEYLNEERYQKVNKKVRFAALLVLLIGLVISGSLFTKGFIDKNNSKNKLKEEKIADSKKLEEYEKEYSELEGQIVSKENECISLDMKDKDWYSKNSRCNLEKINIVSKKNEIDSQIFTLKTKKYESDKTSYIFYGVGSITLFATIGISGMLFFTSKRREIIAYQTQQIMPIAKEGIKEMAPTVGQAAREVMKEMAPAYKEMAKEIAPVYGEIAKGIAKGIKEGIDEGKSGEENEQ